MLLLLPTSILCLKAQNASQGHYIVPLPASCSLFCMLRFIWADANALHMKVSTREDSSSIRQKGQKKQRQKNTNQRICAPLAFEQRWVAT